MICLIEEVCESGDWYDELTICESLEMLNISYYHGFVQDEKFSFFYVGF